MFHWSLFEISIKKLFTLLFHLKGSLTKRPNSKIFLPLSFVLLLTEPYLTGKSETQQRKSETDNDCELIENPLYSSKIEPQETRDKETVFTTPSLVTTTDKPPVKTPSNVNKINPFDAEMGVTLETGVSQGIVTQERGVTPEIQVEAEGSYSKPNPPSSLLLTQKLSHSSSDINFEGESQQVRIVSTHVFVKNTWL